MMKCCFTVVAWLAATAISAAGAPQNLSPNPGAEIAGAAGRPASWAGGPACVWADDEAHSGMRSLKVSSQASSRAGWFSDAITVPRPGCQLALSVWAKMTGVTGGAGAFVLLEHLDGTGKRIGQSAGCSLGGIGDTVTSESWRQYFAFSNLTPDVKAVRIRLSLREARGTVWFDDVALTEYERAPLAKPRPLRRGLRVNREAKLAVVSAKGSDGLAARIQGALKSRGVDAPILPHDWIPASGEQRDLIVLGNLATSHAVEQLYLHYYTFEDLYFPGAGGYVLRPLVDPLGAGNNLLVIGASDDGGLVAGVERLLDDEKLAAYARSGLENIADPAAAAALRTALGALQGDRLIGVVNSLGVLRDEKATGALQQLAADPGKGVVKEALLALGRISTDESIATVRMALRSGPAQFRADAAAACLLAAEGQSALGKAEIATSIYDDVRAADLPKPLRAAALRGVIMCRKDGAVPLLLEQLRSNDAVLRGVALRAARELPGRQITAALITELARSTPSLQALLVGVLVDRRDPVVLKPVESLAGSPSAEVRRAVIQALATIGASSSVPLLLESLASGSETESAAALLSLSRIKADGADAMMLKKLPDLAPPVRAQLIVVLGDRNASGIVPEMLALAANPDATVATAAFKTLAVLAGPDDLAKLLPVALAAPDGPVRSQAERTIYLTLLRALADRRVEPMLKAFAAATRPADKQTLIRILGLLGTQPACAAIQGALNDADASVRDTAFRALVDWPDASAMPWLLATLQSNSPQRQRTLAWRGAIRIATREHTAAPAVEWFQQLNKTAAAQAEKRLLIAGLIELAAERSEGLEMLRPYLDDPAVAAETASMAVQFGKRVEEGRSKVPQPAVLKALLERVAAGDADKPLREEAAALAKQIRGPSAAAGGATPEFRPLFNGRNFDGWEGDTARSFRIVDGAIVGGNLQDKIPRNEFLATTRSYTNFILRAECKLAGPANGGIQIRTQRIPNHNEVRGYQADMSAGKDGGYWGCLYDESRRNKVLARPARDVILKALKPDDWNLYEIRCEGRRIQLFVNGQQTVDYTEPDESIPLSGIIAVQIHGGPPSEAWYRNLIIAELP